MIVPSFAGYGVDNNEQDIDFTFSFQGIASEVLTANISVDWLTLTKVESRAITLHVKRNTGNYRTTIVRVLAKDGSYCYIGVSQQDSNTLFLNAPDIRFNSSSNNGSVQCTSYKVDSINEITSVANWVSGGPSQAQNRFVLNVQNNETDSERTASVSVRCYWGGDKSNYTRLITVTQDKPNMFFDSEDVSFSSAAQSAEIRYFFSGIAASNTKVTSKPDWVTVNSTTSPLQIRLTANTADQPRRGILSIVNGSLSAQINIIQRGFFKLDNIKCIGEDVYQDVTGAYDLTCDGKTIFKGYNIGEKVKINEIAENYLTSTTMMDVSNGGVFYNPDFVHNFSIGGDEVPICNGVMLPDYDYASANIYRAGTLYLMSEPVYRMNMHRYGLTVLSFANFEVGSFPEVTIRSNGLNVDSNYGSGLITIVTNNTDSIIVRSGTNTFTRSAQLDYCFEWQIIYQNIYGGYDVYWVPNLKDNRQKQISRFYYGDWNFNNNNPAERFKTNYKNISTDIITLNMGNLTNLQNDVIYRNLLTSPNIWLVDNNYNMYPANITATSFDSKQYSGRNPQRGSFTISFEIAKSIKVLS